MVGDHAEAHVVFVDGAVAATRELDGAIQNGTQLVRLVDVVDALLDERDALQAHAGVDVLRGQLADDVEVDLRSHVGEKVLHEHEVPDLGEPVVVGGGTAVAAVRRAAVEEDLGVGPAGPRLPGVPVVVGTPEPLDPLGLEPDDVAPDRLRLVVGLVDRDPEILLVEGEPAVRFGGCQELPRVADRAFLEVVAERPVAEHLEEGAVARGLSDLFDVVGSDALLHVGDARDAARERRRSDTG